MFCKLAFSKGVGYTQVQPSKQKSIFNSLRFFMVCDISSKVKLDAEKYNFLKLKYENT